MTEAVDLETPCMLVTDLDAAPNERGIPTVAAERGFSREGLDNSTIDDVVVWARRFQDPPDASLMLQVFTYYWRYDAFPEAPGAGPPPPWEEIQRRLDREFCDCLGPERAHAKCQHDGCTRGSIEHSVMCRVHHFEMVKKRPSPFDD
jgi:hypothetical protein